MPTRNFLTCTSSTPPTHELDPARFGRTSSLTLVRFELLKDKFMWQEQPRHIVIPVSETKPFADGYLKPSESDDLDEFESFLDSTCKSAASLESAVDNELSQHELLREKEIDAHIDEIMEDL